MARSSGNVSKITPGVDVVPVTPSDTALAGGVCKALLIGTAGNINITTLAGNERDDVPVPAGVVPLQCTHVRAGASATAATNIWAIY
jgi:hypothetical protein